MTTACVDELCQTCSTFDLYSLFTGPRYFPNDVEGKQRIRQNIGTLREIKANARCPLCRLVKHTLYGSIDAPLPDPRNWMGEESTKPDEGQVLCYLTPIRSDWDEEMTYVNRETSDYISTTVLVRFDGTADCSEDQRDSIVRGMVLTAGFQLLSPDYVDPKRPLMNGYPITDMKASLDLLAQWLQSCRTKHKGICHDLDVPEAINQDSVISTIRAIDVSTRAIQEHPIAEIEYAALSYVWGENDSKQLRPSSTEKIGAPEPVHLPSCLPKIVEDALYVCTKLLIPFLWVDLYCIDQQNLERKMIEINGMGYIYRRAEITLIDGRDGSSQSTYQGLLPEGTANDKHNLQHLERIGSQEYITTLPGMFFRLKQSFWSQRSWTFQEGNLSKRVAVFNPYDIAFMCRAGTWREGQHAGPYGHDAEIPQLDLRSTGRLALASSSWLRGYQWDFSDYQSILMSYTGRELSFESDKLNAIKGCLSIIENNTGVRFIQGLPSIDFHYALLWIGEQDLYRAGFPSWSWAGWHSIQQLHMLYPRSLASSCLVECEPQSGEWKLQDEYAHHIDLRGAFINAIESPFHPNWCRQWPAPLRVDADMSRITITSEIAHFAVGLRTSNEDSVPNETESETSEEEAEETTFASRMFLRSSSGQCIEGELGSYRPWPPTQVHMPYPIRASSISWLLKEGLELVKILEIDMLEGNAAGDPLPARRVLCLGVDRRRNKPRRFGYVHMTREIWEGASPKPAFVELY